MKRILSCVMAVALVAGMGVSALAADAYNSHGDLTLSGNGLDRKSVVRERVLIQV